MTSSYFIEVDAYDPASASATVLRAVAQGRVNGAVRGGLVHLPVVAGLPSIAAGVSTELPGLGGRGTTRYGALALSVLHAQSRAWRRMALAGREVRIWERTALGVESVWLKALVDGVTLADDRLTLSLSANWSWLDLPVQPAEYDGSGGLGGHTDLAGVRVMECFGVIENAEPDLLDPATQLYRIGTRAISSITAIYDRMRPISWNGINQTSAATLISRANSGVIAPGTFETCNAAGLFALGAEPEGQVTIWATMTGATDAGGIISDLLSHVGVPGGSIDSASITAIRSARAWTSGLVLRGGSSLRDALDLLCVSLGASWSVGRDGLLAVRALDAAATPQALPVAAIVGRPQRQPAVAPPRALKLGYRHNWHVFGANDLGTDYRDRGTYDAAAIYRDGDIVFQPTNGKRYLYVNLASAAGIAPPNVTYWEELQAADPAIATAATTANWSGVTGAAKPADYATTDIVLVATGAVAITGNNVTKTGGTNAWDAGAYSKEGFTGGAYASATVVTVGDLMIGLNGASDLTDAGYTTIDYAMYLTGAGNITTYLSGVTGPTIGTYAVGDVVTVAYDGSVVRWLKNGVVLHTMAVSSDPGRLFLDTSLFQSGQTFGNLRFGPLTSNNWTAIGGAAKPQDGATKNIGGQILPDVDFADGFWTLPSLFERLVGSSIAPSFPARYGLRIRPTGVASQGYPITPNSAGLPYNYTFMVCTPGQRVYAGCWLTSNGPPPDYSGRMYLWFYTASGTYISSTYGVVEFTNGAVARWIGTSQLAPVNAAYCLIGFERSAFWTSGGEWFVGAPYLGFNEPGATAGATWGTDIFSRPTELIDGRVAGGLNSSGQVNTDKVLTASMVANAATVPLAAYTEGTTGALTVSTWTTIQSVTITSTGRPIFINIAHQAQLDAISSTTYTVRILRGGTVIYTSAPAPVQLAIGVPFAFSMTDQPAAGTYLYEVQVNCSQAMRCSNRSLMLLEAKR